MNKSEKEIIYSKICMVEKLLEEYENYLSENSKKLLRRQSILRAFCGGGLLLSLGVFAFGIFNLIFGGYRSATGILLTLISICFAIGLFITVVMISAFYLNSNEKATQFLLFYPGNSGGIDKNFINIEETKE